MLSRLDGLTEYDLRRPVVPSGTNLLGLVKHLAGVEYCYFVEAFGRPRPERLPWMDDGSVWRDADMWATADQPSGDIIALYRRAAGHADRTIDELDLDAPAIVAHWSPERRHTTLAVLLVHMVVETAQHAGHADVARELIDGRVGADLTASTGGVFDAARGAAQVFAQETREPPARDVRIPG